MNAKTTAEQILQQVGGEANVQNLTHCVTRLRFSLRSMDGVDENEVKKIPGVMGVVNKGGQFQVVIGQEVPVVYAELQKLGHFGDPTDTSAEAPKEEKKKGISVVLDTIAGIFSPIMPIIAGAGMIKALLSILTLFSLIEKSGNTYYFLNFIADASYYFLPIFLAASASKKFGCSMQMSMLMGAILLHPNLAALKETGDVVQVLGLPVRIVTYSSSVIPIIMIVFVLSYVEKFVEKITPAMIKFIARPLLTILIMSPIALVVLGPLGSIIGDGLVAVLLSIEKLAPWVLPTVIGALMPFLVMTGMHYSLLPAYVNSLSALGYETVIGPGNLPSNIAQGAAALCVAMKTKNKDFKQLSISSGVTALLGVTEPALFGVNLRLRKPLIATTIGGGLGGLYAGLTGVRRFGGGGAGLAAIGLYVGPDSSNVINALIAAAIAFAVTFAIQWKLGFEDVAAEKESTAGSGTSAAPNKPASVQSKTTSDMQTFSIASPLKGELIPLNEVNDQVFSSGMMGKGAAIRPAEDQLYAPVNGTVVSVFDTKHALGILGEHGEEILIHVGLDTVELGGKHFETHVKAGDTIHTGDLLLSFNRTGIEQDGCDTVTMVILSNTPNFSDVQEEKPHDVNVGEAILTVKA